MMHAYARAVGGAAAGAGAVPAPEVFSPLSIPWHTAFWAEGPSFEALELSDSDPVPIWPDEASGFGDAEQATPASRPIYVASHSSFNNKPVVQGDGSDDVLVTGTGTALSQPNTVVVIGRVASVAIPGTMVGGERSTGGVSHLVTGDANGATGRYRIYAGTNVRTANNVQDSQAHLFIARFDSTDTLEMDGNQVISGNAGGFNVEQLSLFAFPNGNEPLEGEVAFAALLDGVLTVQQKNALLAWSQSYYGTP